MNCCTSDDEPSLKRILRVEKSLDSPSLLWTAALNDPKRKRDYAFLAKLNTASISVTPYQCLRCMQMYTDPQVHFFCHCTGYSKNREDFWERVVNECSVEVSSALWAMDDEDLAETLCGKQLSDKDLDENLDLLKIVAESWRL